MTAVKTRMATKKNGDGEGGGNYECLNQNCKLKYDEKKNQKWLECSICDGLYDIKCQNIDDKQYKFLDSREDVLWLCVICTKAYTNNNRINRLKLISAEIENQIQTLHESIRSMGKENEEVMTKIGEIKSDMSTNINTMQSQVTEIKTSVNEKVDEKIKEVDGNIQRKWTDVVKSIQETGPATAKQLKKAMNELQDYEKEMEMRSKGIVVYRAEELERDPEEEEDAHKADEDLIQALTTHLECEDCIVTYVDRLGKFNKERIQEKKFRPIKVKFQSKEMRDKVLKSLNKLRGAPNRLKQLSIRQDLSQDQREELNEKLKEAYEMTQRTDSLYRVKGNPGEYKITWIRKKDSA